MGAHKENARGVTPFGIYELPSEVGQGGMFEGRQRRIERQKHRHIKIVLPLCKRLNTQPRTIKCRIRHNKPSVSQRASRVSGGSFRKLTTAPRPATGPRTAYEPPRPRWPEAPIQICPPTESKLPGFAA